MSPVPRITITVVIALMAGAACLAADPRAEADMNACFEHAGQAYGIAPVLLEAIAYHESRFNPSAINWNRNGTFDFGIMQVNSSWYGPLGHERWMALAEPCFNIYVGAWILAQCVNRHGYNWKAVGCYHSPNESRRKAYAFKITQALRKLDGKAESYGNR